MIFAGKYLPNFFRGWKGQMPFTPISYAYEFCVLPPIGFYLSLRLRLVPPSLVPNPGDATALVSQIAADYHILMIPSTLCHLFTWVTTSWTRGAARIHTTL